MNKRHFTVEEANDALEKVLPLAEAMVEHRRVLAELGKRWNELGTRIAGNGGGIERRELGELSERIDRKRAAIAACVTEIQAVGAEVKDLDTGLIDFPSLRRGEEVLLCWQVGEDEIRYWHTVEDGFAGRQPLPLD